MTLVKVCGLTRPEDVALAAGLGAWAVGFVLTRGPRRIDPQAAASLVRTAHRTPPANAPLAVLVFTSEPAAEVAQAVVATHADAVQLSAGRAGPSVADVRSRLKASGSSVTTVIAAADAPDAGAADLVLHDSRTPGIWGGTGLTLDWARLARDAGLGRERLVLAGGLTAENVGEAIRRVRPLVVDASSGLERVAGIKDSGKVRAFFAAVAAADLVGDGASAPPRVADREERR
jgi:phosphoribosylanthranilate isomerase